MPELTALTFLRVNTVAAPTVFTVLCPITSYPDIFTAPEKKDCSDLSSKQEKNIPGMIKLPDYKFGVNYEKADYEKVKALEGVAGLSYQLLFGALGEYGAWQWPGDIFTTPSGGGTGDVRKGEITCYPSGDVEAVTIVA